MSKQRIDEMKKFMHIAEGNVAEAKVSPKLRKAGKLMTQVVDGLDREYEDILNGSDPGDPIGQAEDQEFAEHIADDAEDYKKIVNMLMKGQGEEAATFYDDLDTVAREFIYDHIDSDDIIFLQDVFGELGSNWLFTDEEYLDEGPGDDVDYDWENELQGILDARIAGNHAADYRLIQRIDNFIFNTSNEIWDEIEKDNKRLAALKKLAEVIGTGEPTMDDLYTYMGEDQPASAIMDIPVEEGYRDLRGGDWVERPLRTLGSKTLARKLVPGLGKREADERQEDNWFTSRMFSAAELEDPDWEMDDEQRLEYERAKRQGRRYNRIKRGETPFKKSGRELDEGEADMLCSKCGNVMDGTDEMDDEFSRMCGGCNREWEMTVDAELLKDIEGFEPGDDTDYMIKSVAGDNYFKEDLDPDGMGYYNVTIQYEDNYPDEVETALPYDEAMQAAHDLVERMKRGQWEVKKWKMKDAYEWQMLTGDEESITVRVEPADDADAEAWHGIGLDEIAESVLGEDNAAFTGKSKIVKDVAAEKGIDVVDMPLSKDEEFDADDYPEAEDEELGLRFD